MGICDRGPQRPSREGGARPPGPRPRQAYRTEVDWATVRLTGARRCHSLACAEYTRKMADPFGSSQSAFEASRLSAARTLLDQRQHGGNGVLKFGDPANDGRRGQPKLACRIFNQDVLRPLEMVEQRSEVRGSVVHARTLDQATLKLGIRAQQASTVAYPSSMFSGPGTDDQGDHHAADKGS